MVLQLHRFGHPPPIMTAEGLIVLTSQAGTGLLPCDQGEVRKPKSASWMYMSYRSGP